MNKTCALCRASTKLMESHIFPRCFIKLVREETADSKFCEMHAEASRMVQDGPKELLLCDLCEQKISRNEKYFKEAIHLSRHQIQIVHNQQVALVSRLDYAKARLFLLSLIYRMSVSSLRQFEHVSLGDHEDVLRRMIIAEDPGRSDQYPITAMIPLVNGKMEESLLCTPSVSCRDDVSVYHVILGGILYSFYVPRFSNQSEAGNTLNAYLGHNWILNESGDWAMPLTDILEIPFVRALLKQQANNRNSRKAM